MCMSVDWLCQSVDVVKYGPWAVDWCPKRGVFAGILMPRVSGVGSGPGY